MQAELFDEMRSRGWYQVQRADCNKISQRKRNFKMRVYRENLEWHVN